jgi:hypothetical protein
MPPARSYQPRPAFLVAALSTLSRCLPLLMLLLLLLQSSPMIHSCAVLSTLEAAEM